MQVQTIFCNQIQYCVFRTSVRARILKFLSKPSPTPIYYPQVFASALSCNSSDKAIAILRDCRAHPFARWHRFVSIGHREPLQTALQGTLTHAMASICVYRASRTPLDSTPGHIRSRDGLQEEEFLRKTFGAEYEEYCRKVRRYI